MGLVKFTFQSKALFNFAFEYVLISCVQILQPGLFIIQPVMMLFFIIRRLLQNIR